MRVIPINLKTANAFITVNHRHHKAVAGCKFCIGLQDDNGILCGAAICGRPISRYLDNGLTLEITRMCTKGQKNACSMLYGACIKAAKAMGYCRVITYTLQSEDGASLKASNFKYDGTAGKAMWTGARKRDNGVPQELKKRWVYVIKSNEVNTIC